MLSSLCVWSFVSELILRPHAQLIPEFYMTPGDFLNNGFHLDLGTRTRKGPIGDVDLPPWASDARDFVEKACGST
jgi:hypothetical protein